MTDNMDLKETTREQKHRMDREDDFMDWLTVEIESIHSQDLLDRAERDDYYEVLVPKPGYGVTEMPAKNNPFWRNPFIADTKSEIHQPLTSEENMSTEETSVPAEQEEVAVGQGPGFADPDLDPTPNDVTPHVVDDEDDEGYDTGEETEDEEWIDEEDDED